jgi:hypothetical protein
LPAVEELDLAIAKARKLVAAIEQQKAELEASSRTQASSVPPEKLAEGKRAFKNALASARRMLSALEGAAAIAPDRLPDTNDPS